MAIEALLREDGRDRDQGPPMSSSYHLMLKTTGAAAQGLGAYLAAIPSFAPYPADAEDRADAQRFFGFDAVHCADPDTKGGEGGMVRDLMARPKPCPLEMDKVCAMCCMRCARAFAGEWVQAAPSLR